ncbi:hypothetical protein T4C_1378 [Trichinella pseudospiralis]|uniref:Uncharacterized protein n=1 Tax=Trichinella pseudospiralis TaxID=6337 RepID=A0A0V1KAB4_TRIPS|nr:hypothetical protein T4C_1378 [Trichinella pseudospiralis]
MLIIQLICVISFFIYASLEHHIIYSIIKHLIKQLLHRMTYLHKILITYFRCLLAKCITRHFRKH